MAGATFPLVAEQTRRKLSRSAGGDILDLGEPAPDFTLRRTFEESVSLAAVNASRPVLLVFYVFDFGHV